MIIGFSGSTVWETTTPSSSALVFTVVPTGYLAIDDSRHLIILLSHHENMAGTGFPMKQKNKELECRIIQACDAFDSLISGMECKRICVQEAINQIKENDGGRYDNKIIKSLLKIEKRLGP